MQVLSNTFILAEERQGKANISPHFSSVGEHCVDLEKN
jgi:hypothetical protein